MAKEFIIFGVDSCSSSHVVNCKNNFLILGLGPPFGINGSFGSAEKKFINFTKANTKFCLNLHYDACLLMEKKQLSLKLTIKMLTLRLDFA